MADVTKKLDIKITGDASSALGAFDKLAQEEKQLRYEQEKLNKETKEYDKALRDFTHEEQKAERASKKLGKTMADVGDTTASSGSSFGLLSVGILAAVAAGAKMVSVGYDIAASFARSASEIEQTKVRFGALFGSGEIADRAVDWAVEFAKTTPLVLADVTSRMAKLKAAGFDPLDDSLGIMRKLGDTTAALGIDFDRLMAPLRKLNSGGKATFESINQLAEAGIPIYDLLNDKLGMTAEEIQNIAKANISGKKIGDAIIESLGTKYAGAMEKMSNTAEGAFSTILDLLDAMKRKIADGGAWAAFKKFVIEARDGLAQFADSDAFTAFANAFGSTAAGALSETSRIIRLVATDLNNLMPVLTLSTKMMHGFASSLDPFTAAYEFATGDDIVQRSEKRLAEFEEHRLKFYKKLKAAKIEASIDYREGDLDVAEKFDKKAHDEAWKLLKEKVKQEKKINDKAAKEELKANKKRFRDLKALGTKMAKEALKALKMQKKQELAAIKVYEDRMKRAIIDKYTREKLYFKQRTDLAIASYRAEVAAARKARSRIAEDRGTSFDRDISDVFSSVQKKMAGESTAAWTNAEKNFLKGAGEEGVLFSTRGFGLSDKEERKLQRYVEDQKKRNMRQIEDEEAYKRKLEDERLKKMQDDQKRGLEEINKRQIAALKELARQIEGMKVEVEQRLTITDTNKFVAGFISSVFERAGVVAETEGVTIAGVA